MELFSQREGMKPIRTGMQLDSIDGALRNRLWNAVVLHYLDYEHIRIQRNHVLYGLMESIWHDYFKQPVDLIGTVWFDIQSRLRRHFMGCQWFEVYDFIEFVATSYYNNAVNLKFIDFCNDVLEQELSAYRFVGGRITRVTSEEEITEIEEALDVPLKPVTNHLKGALDLLADRESPDFRNSIKESISAIEAISKILTGKTTTTLGQALKEIEEKVGLHPALKEAFSSLYGYTSAADGIRHALLDESDLDFEDAKFMLVSCSAFINYLMAKAAKAGIEL